MANDQYVEVEVGEWRVAPSDTGGAMVRIIAVEPGSNLTMGDLVRFHYPENATTAKAALGDVRKWPKCQPPDVYRRLHEQNKQVRAAVAKGEAPVPMLIWCPECHERHVDDGVWKTKPHHTHACQHCGFVWRPAVAPTVGVLFLPGFKDGEP